MKKLSFILMFAMITLSACNFSSKQNISDPKAYDDFIENLLKQLEKTENDLAQSYTTGLEATIESTYLNSLGAVKILQKSIDNLDTFKGDGRLQKAVSAYLAFFKGVYEKEYREIVNIMKKSGPSDEDRNRFDEIYNSIENQKALLRKEIIESREEFQKKYLGKN